MIYNIPYDNSISSFKNKMNSKLKKEQEFLSGHSLILNIKKMIDGIKFDDYFKPLNKSQTLSIFEMLRNNFSDQI